MQYFAQILHQGFSSLKPFNKGIIYHISDRYSNRSRHILIVNPVLAKPGRGCFYVFSFRLRFTVSPFSQLLLL
jgi:hypothetical protein